MAGVVTSQTNSIFTITIGADTPGDWSWIETWPAKLDGIKLWAIKFDPGADGALKCVIGEEGNDDDPLFSIDVSGKTDARILYLPPNVRYKPVLDYSDGTYNAASVITFYLLGEY